VVVRRLLPSRSLVASGPKRYGDQFGISACSGHR
jgi:hypothetical protein